MPFSRSDELKSIRLQNHRIYNYWYVSVYHYNVLKNTHEVLNQRIGYADGKVTRRRSVLEAGFVSPPLLQGIKY